LIDDDFFIDLFVFNQALMMNPTEIIDAMMQKDLFSQWLGIERLEERTGFCKLQMTVRAEMCNGFEIAHGGITYSLADSALAFASNSNGKHALSIETSISHIRSVKSGDTLIAIADEKHRSSRIGIYEVRVENTEGELVGLFKGTVFVKDVEWGKQL
jgi:acyl-CoA thioesterase